MNFQAGIVNIPGTSLKVGEKSRIKHYLELLKSQFYQASWLPSSLSFYSFSLPVDELGRKHIGAC